jgi:hypothetical protein
LTRRSGDLPKAGDDCSLKNQTIVIKPENVLHVSVIATLTPAYLALVKLFTDGYKAEPLPNKIIKLLRDGVKPYSEISHVQCDKNNNVLHYR